jgi:thiamine biosynthesis lipoprotein ApbE
VIHGSFPAMGTSVEVWSRGEGEWNATRDLFAEMEARLSRFRADSELERLNSDPRCEVPVSDALAGILRHAAHLRTITNGLVDVGVGGSVVDWGYDRTFLEVVDRAEVPPPRPSGWTIDTEDDVVRRDPGVRLDLGGIAKGWTADRAVEWGLAVVVSAGGDIRSNDPRTEVPVDDGFGGTAARVVVGRGGLATSSTARRRWRVAARDVSHLIDPRHGAPVRSPIVTATAVADSALLAEAAAKAVLLSGEDGLDWASRASWIRGALVVWHDGSVYATTGMETAA